MPGQMMTPDSKTCRGVMSPASSRKFSFPHPGESDRLVLRLASLPSRAEKKKERTIRFAEIYGHRPGRLRGRHRPLRLGSYIGSRYGLRFPYGTLVINISGSFLLGFIVALLSRIAASQYWWYLLPIGFVGAYTTFSTFEYETLRAVQDGQVAIGLLNVALSVLVGFVAVWAGATWEEWSHETTGYAQSVYHS